MSDPPLAEDPMLALLPQGHPLADASAYPLKDCEKDDFIMPALGCDDDERPCFDTTASEPKIRFTTMENFSECPWWSRAWASAS